MKRFDHLRGVAAALPDPNIDTDQILPKQFLKVVERTGLARALFYDQRFDENGTPKAGFVLSTPPYDHACILITGENFACGSSREHAVWALIDFGITCVIAPSFGEIFYNNCFNNGLLPIVLPSTVSKALGSEACLSPSEFLIDLPTQTICAPSGTHIAFAVDNARKQKLLAGLDEIGETLEHRAAIEAYEARRTPFR